MADPRAGQTAAHWAASRAVCWVVPRAAWKAELLVDVTVVLTVAYLVDQTAEH